MQCASMTENGPGARSKPQLCIEQVGGVRRLQLTRPEAGVELIRVRTGAVVLICLPRGLDIPTRRVRRHAHQLAIGQR